MGLDAGLGFFDVGLCLLEHVEERCCSLSFLWHPFLAYLGEERGKRAQPGNPGWESRAYGRLVKQEAKERRMSCSFRSHRRDKVDVLRGKTSWIKLS